MDNYAYTYHPALSTLGEVLGVVFWILLIVLILAAIRRLVWGGMYFRSGMHNLKNEKYSSGNGGETERKEAMEILKERYARGEIDKTEFEMKKKDVTV